MMYDGYRLPGCRADLVVFTFKIDGLVAVDLAGGA